MEETLFIMTDIAHALAMRIDTRALGNIFPILNSFLSHFRAICSAPGSIPAQFWA
jgi:hypothetical protein